MKKNKLLKSLIIFSILLALIPAGCKDKSDDWPTSGDIMDLQPMKDQFSDYFMMGNIATVNDYSGGQITNEKLLRHYNILTAENDMKPDTYGGSRFNDTVSGLTFTKSDAFVTAALASGFKAHAHVLLWHSQNSGWIGTNIGGADKATAIAAMKDYITQVVTHFKGKVYSWDVLNEVFPDTPASGADWKTAMRQENPWFKAIGSDFVFEGFKAARLADPGAILYYNDYNLDNANKAGAVERMVRDVNNQWKSDPAYDNRLLIEGIGMQSHHNTGVSENAIKASLDRFRPLGVRISISELDVLCGGYSGTIATSGPSKVTSDADRTKAADRYGDYFKIFLQYSDIIERVTFWGVYDEQSWRSAGEPLPFSGSSPTMSKPAYEKILEAFNEHEK